jgi:hypothetical protein
LRLPIADFPHKGSAELLESAVTFSQDKVWADMVALFRAHREQLIAVVGVFLFLPAFASELIAPQPDNATTFAAMLAELQQWVRDYWPLLLGQAVISALGNVTLYALLLRREAGTLAAAFQIGASSVISLILANLLIGLIFGLGLFLFIVPGFYLMARTSVAGAAIVAESRRDPASAVGRSFALTKGSGWRIFAMFALIVTVWAVGTLVGGGLLSLLFRGLLPVPVATFANAMITTLMASVLGLVSLIFSAATYRQLSA